MRLIVLLTLLIGCNTEHNDEAQHLTACATACQKGGTTMAHYNDTTGDCACSPPTTAPSASR